VSDRAREGLFSSLGELVLDARCLDLYAGTGAMGIEALSRGARSCDLVDSGPEAVKVIRENLRRAGVADRARSVRADARAYLERSGDPYDLAFVDPPYAEPTHRLGATLSALVDRLAPDGRFALTRERRSSTDVVPVDWLVERRLSYGDTLILVCREGL
ncbi:MAG TPA: RsmD family RNA methyltransferase, partial [Actinomycetota bacterium]|nr:RsmD family RNA methyltransferase [Actinomycetota bacterium]